MVYTQFLSEDGQSRRLCTWYVEKNISNLTFRLTEYTHADGPALRLHFGDEHKLPHDLARALLDVLGHDATNTLFEESDVRQFLIPLKPCQPFTDGDSSNLPLCPAS